MLYSQEEKCKCAIFKFDKQPSQEFHDCFCVRSFALRLIYTVYSSFAFSSFLSWSMVLFILLPFFFFPQGCVINIFGVILHSALKNIKV